MMKWVPEYDPEGLWVAVDEEVALVVLHGRGTLRLRVEHGGEHGVRVLERQLSFGYKIAS